MSEMVDIVTYAIKAEIGRQMSAQPIHGHATNWYACAESRELDLAIIARAVIEVMRNPTKAMVDAACETDRKTDQYCATGEEHWQSMIDEALK